jgi:hypothetical protein
MSFGLPFNLVSSFEVKCDRDGHHIRLRETESVQQSVPFGKDKPPHLNKMKIIIMSNDPARSALLLIPALVSAFVQSGPAVSGIQLSAARPLSSLKMR